VVEFLVERGTDVNVRDHDRCTPLMYAARDGHLDTVLMLLYLGADPTLINARDKAAHELVCLGGNKHHREAIMTALEVR
jgi:uncharacterized protein